MILDMQTGLIDVARFVESPNHDQRECCSKPEVIVIHCISLPPGQYGGEQVCNFFCNQLDYQLHEYFQHIKDVQVSSHFYIRRDGDLIQFVPTHLRAWHAGESICLGRAKVNDFSIGIELEGLDTDPDGFTGEQYRKLITLTKTLMSCYPVITKQRIFAHSDIAPQRKTDPGIYFDWSYFFSELC